MAQTSKDTVAAMVSSGIASLVLLEELAGQYKTVVPIYVVSGLIWEPVERYWLRRFHRQMKRRHNSIGDLIDISLPLTPIYRRGYWALEGGEVPSRFAADTLMELPGRTLLLLTATSVFCQTHGVGELAIGTLAGAPFKDQKPEFLEHFEVLTGLGLKHKVKILTPLIKLKKAAVLRKATDLPLDQTFSCISPKGRKHCGHCYKCGERIRAFEEIKKLDPAGIFKP